MTANQQGVPEFKLVLVGDGGVGEFNRFSAEPRMDSFS